MNTGETQARDLQQALLQSLKRFLFCKKSLKSSIWILPDSCEVLSYFYEKKDDDAVLFQKSFFSLDLGIFLIASDFEKLQSRGIDEIVSSLPHITKAQSKISEASNWNNCINAKEYLARFYQNLCFLQTTEPSCKLIYTQSFARVGLMGNPSDGFFGKTISFTIMNYWVDIWLKPNMLLSDSSIQFMQHPLLDPHSFFSIQSLSLIVKKNGYYGVHRLFLATLKVFFDYCQQNQFRLENKPGFQLFYQTNIPRQVGLSGSSAFVTGILKAIIQYYELETKIPLAIQANLALFAERDELGISAGYQDRVIQTMQGCVFMDFQKTFLQEKGHGIYTPLPISSLPKGFWIAYIAQPKESGKVHHTMKSRFESGDKEVVEAMHTFASYAERAKQALEAQDSQLLAKLMNANFDLRKTLYGDEVIGTDNLYMIHIARKYGHAAKFCGSGGCILGLWAGLPQDPKRDTLTLELQEELLRNGFVFSFVHV